MSESTAVILELEKTCRTCLAQKTADELRSLSENNLCSAIGELANIEVILSQFLPSVICTECIKYLNIAINFRKQVLNSESQLKHLINNMGDNDMTLVYESYTVLNEGVISEEYVTEIKEIVVKDDKLNLDESIVNHQENPTDISKDLFKNKTDIYIASDDLSEDNNTDSINYYVTENNDEPFTSVEPANSPSKSAIVLNSTLNKVIKWANSDLNSCHKEAKIDLRAIQSTKIVNFRCDLCSKTFRFEFIYKVHRLKHGFSIKCTECFQLFSDMTSYLKHTKQLHPNFKPYACPSCSQRFFTLTPLKIHFKNHIPNHLLIYKCEQCDRRFTKKYSLKVHKKTHSTGNPFKCQVCNKVLSGMQSLKSHLKIHGGEKKYKCDICGASFIHRFSLTNHLVTHTGEKRFACKLCNKRFTTSSYLKVHMRSHTLEKPYKCKFCSKSAISQTILKAHERTHTGERSYQCDICGFRSARAGDLQIHIRKHTGERPYKCDQCDKNFMTSSNLATHKRSHLGIRSHVCEICNKGFVDPRVLKSHIRVHTGEKPYQCHVCGQRFRQSTQLSSHRKKLHEKEQDA